MTSFGTKLSFTAAALLAVVGATGAAMADDAPSWGSISAYVAVTTDYRYRGISQDSREATPQGSINWSGPDGFYAGTWESKVNWNAANDPSFEADWYAGKHFDLDGTDLNVEAYYYSYPDANIAKLGSTKSASYYETIVQLSHTFGPLTLTVTGANSPQWSLGGGTGWYTEGTAAYTITDWLSISGNVGHQWVDAAPKDYTHYDIGLTATWKSWSFDARYFGNDIGNANCGFWIGTPHGCADNFVFTATYNIANLLQ